MPDSQILIHFSNAWMTKFMIFFHEQGRNFVTFFCSHYWLLNFTIVFLTGWQISWSIFAGVILGLKKILEIMVNFLKSNSRGEGSRLMLIMSFFSLPFEQICIFLWSYDEIHILPKILLQNPISSRDLLAKYPKVYESQNIKHTYKIYTIIFCMIYL